MKVWATQVTSDGAGEWSLDITNGGFTTVFSVCATALAETASVVDRVWASLRSISSTLVRGYTLRGSTVVLASPTVRTAPNVQVNVLVFGA